ncbi:DUF1304 family protein [Kitasatospora sp. NPDC056327]|uniref:DUF1304 family protein n=1 Tax=Kitasatospora sp. NPDC056327 TaxID=3345785 RepID=UPI0035D84B4F
MNGVSQVFALITAGVHLVLWPLESFLFGHPRVRRLLTRSTADTPGLRLWRVNTGFYNLFLALGLLAGLVALHRDEPVVGRTLITYLSAFLVAAGLTLLASAPRLWRGALGQAVPPAVVLLAELLA